MIGKDTSWKEEDDKRLCDLGHEPNVTTHGSENNEFRNVEIVYNLVGSVSGARTGSGVDAGWKDAE